MNRIGRTIARTLPESIRGGEGPARCGFPWTREEMAVILSYAVKLTRGHYPYLNFASVDCLAELRSWYRRRPRRPGERSATYPRGYHSVRCKIYQAARAIGKPLCAALWTPEERAVTRKWARKTIGPFGLNRTKWTILDAARMALMELEEKGHERTIASCESEVRKCREDILHRRTRGYGRKFRKRSAAKT